MPERYGSDQWVVGNTAYSGTWSERTPTGRGNAIKVWSLSATGIPTLADSIILPNVGTISDVHGTDDGKVLIATAEGGERAGALHLRSRQPASRSCGHR